MCLDPLTWKGPRPGSSFFVSQAVWLRTELLKASRSCAPSVNFATSRDLPYAERQFCVVGLLTSLAWAPIAAPPLWASYLTSLSLSVSFFIYEWELG